MPESVNTTAVDLSSRLKLVINDKLELMADRKEFESIEYAKLSERARNDAASHRRLKERILKLSPESLEDAFKVFVQLVDDAVREGGSSAPPPVTPEPPRKVEKKTEFSDEAHLHTETAVEKGLFRDELLALLREHPERLWRRQELMAALDVPMNRVRKALAILLRKGQIEKPSSGHYCMKMNRPARGEKAGIHRQ
ncbi:MULTISPECIES: hypothetical protein [Actinosynnema]|uniref:hypothetical protein n=1 Tax=Actinosynnema TaxID=40566 RepID=UPI0020A343EC|nr:hypothetical protein [Actinosynnema pretiosum]